MLAAEEADRAAVSGPIGVLGFLAIVPVVFAATLSLTMRAGLMAGQSVKVAAGLSVLSVAGLALVSFGWVGLRDLRPTRPSRVELTVAAALLGMLVALWDRAADRSLLWPHLVGVDPAHHAAIVRWISESNGLPTVDSQLGGLVGYPVGAHVIAAAITSVSGLTPVTGMWLTALGAGAAQLFAIAWLTRTFSPRRSWTGVGVAILLWLGAWNFGIGAITITFFFAQVVAVTFSLVGVGLVALGARGLAVRKWLPSTVVLLLATVLTYPQSAVVIPGALGAFAVVRAVDALRAGSKSQRRNAAIVSAGLAVAIGAIALHGIDSPYLTRQAFYGVAEGGLPALSVGAAGGVVAVGLFAAGALELLARAIRGDRPALVLGAAIAAPTAVLGALVLLRALGEPVTTYRITKNVYMILPLICAATGVAVSSAAVVVAAAVDQWRGPNPRRSSQVSTKVAGQTRPVRAWTAAGAIVIAIGVTLGPGLPKPAAEPLVDQDAYVLGAYAVKNFEPQTIGVAGEGISPYVLWFVFLRGNALGSTKSVAPRFTEWDDWPTGRRADRYLLVDGSIAPRFVGKPGVKVIARRGGALLLERSLAADLANPSSANVTS